MATTLETASGRKTLSDRINRIQVSATMAVVAEACKLRETGADLVDFGAGEPHFSTPEHIKEAAVEAIHQNFSKYTPVPGTPALRKAIVARHAQDFGSQYKVEETIASTGGKHALFNAIQVLVDHGMKSFCRFLIGSHLKTSSSTQVDTPSWLRPTKPKTFA